MSRNAIVELLHAGHSDRAIARQLNRPERHIAAIRRELRIPRRRPGPKPSTVEGKFWRRAQPTDDGHLLWPGLGTHGTGLQHPDGRKESIHRVAFRIGNQREPEGIVRTGCTVSGCVHPAHVEDAPMRRQYTAIFGRTA